MSTSQTQMTKTQMTKTQITKTPTSQTITLRMFANGASKIIKWLKENSNKYSKDYKGQYYQEQQYFEELIVNIYLVYIPSGGAGVIYFYPTRHKYPHFTIPVDMNGKVHYTTTEIERDYDPNNWIYFANFLLKLGSSYIHLE